jgi:hypothetical protein
VFASLRRYRTIREKRVTSHRHGDQSEDQQERLLRESLRRNSTER